jgi:hypothetical protein
MTARAPLPCRLGPFGCAVALSCLAWSPARAQPGPELFDPTPRPAVVLHDLNLWAAAPEGQATASQTARIRLPRMPVTFLGEPLGLIDSDADAPAPGPAAAPTPSELEAADLARVQVAMGEDNPFFDFRRRGAPGGVGFYKLHTQLQLFDTGMTGCTLTCQAVRPAGLESNGVNDGPSFVSPALTLFHDLGDGTALHGFVGKDVRANATWRDGLTDSFRYGVALQQPVPGLTTDPNRGLFLFVEALGRWGDRDRESGAVHTWEVVPGLHYRMSDSWWLSGGVLVPVGPARTGSGQWHLACSWQY